jgi:histidinol-phosphate aminotransferase
MAGFIERTARREIFALKPYVPGKPIEEVERELGIRDIVKMASNENPLGPSPMAVEAVREVAGSLHLYPDSICFYLRQKMAAKTGRAPECFLVGNGSDELLRLISETFLTPEAGVVYADPSFVEYEFMARIMGARCTPVPLVDFRHDLSAMKAAIGPQTRIVYVCNPNNPTGSIVTRAELEEFMDGMPDEVLVVFDEAYVEYVDSPEFQSGLEYLDRGHNVVVLRTFSKIYGLAGLRIGYGITTPEIAAAVNRVREPFNVNLAAQKAAMAALDDEEHLALSRETNRWGRKYLCEEFQRLGLRYVDTQANFLFVDTGRDCQQVFSRLLAQGIIVRTGDIFGYPTFIRVTIGTESENRRFVQGLVRALEG